MNYFTRTRIGTGRGRKHVLRKQYTPELITGSEPYEEAPYTTGFSKFYGSVIFILLFIHFTMKYSSF